MAQVIIWLALNTQHFPSVGSTTRLHGRLSVYYSSEPPGEGEGNGAGDEELDDSDEDSDRDDETVMSESNLGDMIYGDFDGEDDDLMDMEISGMQQETLTASSLFQSGESNAKRRIRPGPPQDNDVSTSKRIPPQVHLMRVETLLHKISKKVAVEMIHTMPTEDKDAGKDASGAELSASAKKRKVVMDEFDKLLGLQFRSANPVTRIASSFLGPLMRMFRIFLFLVRISFNISTWRDPYLSFLVFVALSILCLVLVVFPWRTFLFFASVGAVGPQVRGTN